MANIMRPSSAYGMRALDPFEMMRDMLSRIDRDLVPIVDPSASFMPTFEFIETESGYKICGDMPGVDESDLDISVEGNTLTIRGKRDEERHEDNEQIHAYERRFGTFMRSFSLPQMADSEKVEASLDKGVLTLTMPRREGTSPRRIKIGNGGKRLEGGNGGKAPEGGKSAGGGKK